MLDLTDSINEMINERNMDEKNVQALIKDMLVSAYKRKYGTDENVEIAFTEDNERKLVDVLVMKKVVLEENWYNPVTEIAIDEAVKLTDAQLEPGDFLQISIDPKTFESPAVQSAKQRQQQLVKEYSTDRAYVDAKAMEGKLVIGEIKDRRDKTGDYLVNLNLEPYALFPVRGQSPRESYEIAEKLKFYVEKVDRGDEIETNDRRKGFKNQKRQRGVRILLSRASKEFVKALIENEVPEISSGDVEIKSIARQAGVRTKVAVDSRKSDLDPVGATVGKSGTRIQTIMAECEGEKIDVVRYSDDPLEFIANALIPAQVKRVVMINPETRHVVAIVQDNQQGIAIGQGGVNVTLAKKLCDWNIEVKTQAQFDAMEETQQIYSNIENIFKQDSEDTQEEAIEEASPLTNAEIGIDEDDTPISDIGLPESLVKKLQNMDIWSIEEFFDYTEEELVKNGLTEEEYELVNSSVEITEEDADFECPQCHGIVPAGSTVCPHCGVEFEFE